jgi:Zn ribbon nucleic-acid-binding protein
MSNTINQPKDEDHHVESISCPECNAVQDAIVLHRLPWYTYIHECVKCHYTIMESEWINVKNG